MTRRRIPKQLSFAERPRLDGKPRQRSGPKPRADRSTVGMPHCERVRHSANVPLHITMRAVDMLPSFREQVLYKSFERAVRDTRRSDFRIVHFSVQSNHLHLIVEASDKDALSRGMKSFSVRANRLFNSACGRMRGQVWKDRYHRRDLTSPRQVRHALVYCLNNYRKHSRITTSRPVVDRCSSARWFDGWCGERIILPDEKEPPPRAVALPKTFLLRAGWRRHGLLSPTERPQS